MATMASPVTDKLLLCHEASWKKVVYTFVRSINSFLVANVSHTFLVPETQRWKNPASPNAASL